MNKTQLVELDYKGSNILIGRTPTYKLYRASIDGKLLVNTFFKSLQQALDHCRAQIDLKK